MTAADWKSLRFCLGKDSIEVSKLQKQVASLGAEYNVSEANAENGLHGLTFPGQSNARRIVAAMSGLVNVPRTPSPAAKTPRTPVSPLSSGRPLSRTGRYLPEPYTSEERQKRIDAVVDREKEAQAREDELRSELFRLNHANEGLIDRNGTLAKEKSELTQKVAKLEEQAQDAQDLQEGLQDRADKMQDQLGKLQGESIGLNQQISELQDGAEKHRQEVKGLEANVGRAESEKNSADRELKEVESKYQDNLANLNQQISSKDATLKLWKGRYDKALADWKAAERCRGVERQDTEKFKALSGDLDKRIAEIQEELSREKTKHAEKVKDLKKAREDLVNLKEIAEEDRTNAVKRLEAQKAAEKRAEDLEAELQRALEQNQESTEATARLQAAESKIIALEQEIEDRDKEDTEVFEQQQARRLNRERRKRERSGGLNGDEEPEAKRLRPSPENWNPEDDPSF